MDRATIEPAIRIVLTDIHSKLAAYRKSRRGLRAGRGVAEGVTVSMDI
jgi:hypothetical protein